MRRPSKLRRIGDLVLGSALGLLVSASPAAAQYDLSRWTVDGGGVTAMGNMTYALGSTAGQPDAGLLGVAGWRLRGGFWMGGTATLAVDPHGVRLPDIAAPLAFGFHPIEPNPAFGRARLRFDLPHATGVTLRIFDVQGRQVRSIAAERFEAGAHLRAWDATDDDGRPVPAGLYLALIETAEWRAMRRLALLH